jgi:hypothetical protein
MLEVIGAGLGRTGTYSLKLALEQLGLGPCHHMEEVLKDAPRQIPLWHAAALGQADWTSILDGYGSAVDWPSAAYWRELADAHPEARVILTVRDPGTWCDSFQATIQPLLARADEASPQIRPWFDMCSAMLTRHGLDLRADRPELLAFFESHVKAVKEGVPASRLLVFEARQGWEPLCDFLGKTAPQTPFPRSNNRQEFEQLARLALS